MTDVAERVRKKGYSLGSLAAWRPVVTSAGQFHGRGGRGRRWVVGGGFGRRESRQ